jgi:UDP-N-acetylmuramyl pentapeptide phosphotransferase/UDP-N-acetylglucosamine-1-phosphate transferase
MSETFRMWGLFGAIILASVGTSYFLTMALRPLLRKYTLARPNARSSHKTPTPQGGGIAVIVSTSAIVAISGLAVPIFGADFRHLGLIFAMSATLAAVGVTDDIRPLEALPRLLLQTIVVIVVVASLPTELRVLPLLPWWFERAIMVIAVIWFVNLVNFMDGIDWMTVAEVVPVTGALALFGLMGALPRDATLVALALCGAMIGFAPFNRPVARLFLGDVGSLPIGLLLAWLLILLAGQGHLAAAILLPLYYLADATITLLRRLVNGEPIMQAHRSHFYQRASERGFSDFQIVWRVFALNLLLCALAGKMLVTASAGLRLLILVTSGVLVGALLLSFNGGLRWRR